MNPDPGATARYAVRVLPGTGDLARVQRFRAACFGLDRALDTDPFDSRCTQVVVDDTRSGAIVGCVRLMRFGPGQIAQSCAAQFYDLSALAHMTTPCLEVGRLCSAPGPCGPSILRMLQRAIAREISAAEAGFVFGCASFQGTDPDCHGTALAVLAAHHRAPPGCAPGRKSAEAVAFPAQGAGSSMALRAMPPLLRLYLRLGAWVSDHAVIDRDLGTLHVFTGLDLATVPEARRHIVRAVPAREACPATR